MEKIAITMVCVAIMAAIGLLAAGTIRNQEKLECGIWQKEALEFKDAGYYVAKWQKDQCESYGMELDAVVK